MVLPERIAFAMLARSLVKEKDPAGAGSICARYWDRTSDLFRVREARYRCANRACSGYSVVRRGGDGIRTRVYGFAGRCLASRPRHRSFVTISYRASSGTRADDETRTRDPHLGKVMRYQLRYIRISPRYRDLNNYREALPGVQIGAAIPGAPPERAQSSRGSRNFFSLWSTGADTVIAWLKGRQRW